MTYVSIDESEVSEIKFEDICGTSVNKLLRTKDGSKVMVTFKGETPKWLEGKPTKTQPEMFDIIQDLDGDWMPDGMREIVLAK